jgi:hypothetical protein
MLLTSARTALLVAAVLAAVGCAGAPASSGVVVAPLAPSSTASTPTVDPSTAPASGDASVAVGDAAPPTGKPGDAGAAARFRACSADVDCVAVPRVGCCHNGWNEAVAVTQKDAYAASFVCPEAHPICAMFLVRDTRVPQCDGATHLCGLVAK